VVWLEHQVVWLKHQVVWLKHQLSRPTWDPDHRVVSASWAGLLAQPSWHLKQKRQQAQAAFWSKLTVSCYSATGG